MCDELRLFRYDIKLLKFEKFAVDGLHFLRYVVSLSKTLLVIKSNICLFGCVIFSSKLDEITTFLNFNV
jgi:hypothetical protein